MSEWTEILEAIGLALAGERDAGQAQLRDCWERTTDQQHAQRCVLAHYLADLESELEAEIAWDERAINEFSDVGEFDLVPIGISSAAAMAPSLHLNLGDGYLRASRIAEARTQVVSGIASSGLLDDTGYGALIRSGLDRLLAKVELAEDSSAGL
ncbi:MAG TPA: hypothetical protein DDY88_04095 [Actinobacteria bacterium]|nr:hypothetical protein [Actinomycetota bacterium]